ncbi:hypothetical protein E2C01_099969 [Portunus trituberculatus]|uniref:Uncharacterized protein n=1 Tax=Portunus trituberculatus TaxID=210409 RepID=A0A5B7KAU8_PORTR|nr:hypothetical protein [Portunus trituberculatus]
MQSVSGEVETSQVRAGDVTFASHLRHLHLGRCHGYFPAGRANEDVGCGELGANRGGEAATVVPCRGELCVPCRPANDTHHSALSHNPPCYYRLTTRPALLTGS